MNAQKARNLYFEYYVVLENEIKTLIKIYIPNFQIKNKTFKDILNKLFQYSIENKLDLKTKTWQKQRKVRNWLAHKSSDSDVPFKFLSLLNSIEKELEEIAFLKKQLKFNSMNKR